MKAPVRRNRRDYAKRNVGGIAQWVFDAEGLKVSPSLQGRVDDVDGEGERQKGEEPRAPRMK